MNARRRRPALRSTLASLALVAGACAPVSEPLGRPSPECTLVPGGRHEGGRVAGGSAGGGTLDVYAPGRVEPARAPIPTTPAERVIFRHLYETLIRADCRGRPLPSLAASWEPEEGGRAWRFTLRRGAAFWDGAPVLAADVIESWRTVPAIEAGGSAEGLLVAVRSRLRSGVAATAVAIDERTVRLVFDRPEPAPPPWLADPALAVHHRASGGGWPQGTGTYRLDGAAARPGPAGTPDRIILFPRGRLPDDPRPVLRFRLAPPLDPREALDEGAEVVITDDPTALAYARTLPDHASIPLPWDRTYALLAPAARGEGAAGGESATGEGAAAGGAVGVASGEAGERGLREALASDAVRGEARPARPGTAGAACLDSGSGRHPARPRVAYPAGDPAARGLAERLVALAAAGGSLGRRPAVGEGAHGAAGPPDSGGAAPSDPGVPGTPAWVLSLPTAAVGLQDAELVEALRTAGEAAFVLPLTRLAGLPCTRPEEAARATVWRVRPLVDARYRAVVRAGAATVTVDLDGTPRLVGAGEESAGP